MESWRKVWREGVAPNLSTKSLEVLKSALENNDPRLIQRLTTIPQHLAYARYCPVEACCAIGYAGWQGENLNSVEEIEEFFAKMCFKIDEKLGEPAACRWFLNWHDDTPREEMIKQLLPEVVLALQQREELAPTA